MVLSLFNILTLICSVVNFDLLPLPFTRRLTKRFQDCEFHYALFANRRWLLWELKIHFKVASLWKIIPPPCFSALLSPLNYFGLSPSRVDTHNRNFALGIRVVFEMLVPYYQLYIFTCMQMIKASWTCHVRPSVCLFACLFFLAVKPIWSKFRRWIPTAGNLTVLILSENMLSLFG